MKKILYILNLFFLISSININLLKCFYNFNNYEKWQKKILINNELNNLKLLNFDINDNFAIDMNKKYEDFIYPVIFSLINEKNNLTKIENLYTINSNSPFNIYSLNYNIKNNYYFQKLSKYFFSKTNLNKFEKFNFSIYENNEYENFDKLNNFFEKNCQNNNILNNFIKNIISINDKDKEIINETKKNILLIYNFFEKIFKINEKINNKIKICNLIENIYLKEKIKDSEDKNDKNDKKDDDKDDILGQTSYSWKKLNKKSIQNISLKKYIFLDENIGIDEKTFNEYTKGSKIKNKDEEENNKKIFANFNDFVNFFSKKNKKIIIMGGGFDDNLNFKRNIKNKNINKIKEKIFFWDNFLQNNYDDNNNKYIRISNILISKISYLNWIKSNYSTPFLSHFLLHEFGHVFHNLYKYIYKIDIIKSLQNFIFNKIKNLNLNNNIIKKNIINITSVSNYGRVGETDWFAECFAYWILIPNEWRTKIWEILDDFFWKILNTKI